MSNGINSLYEFEGFRLDTQTLTLWRGNDVISLSPKAAELLKLLIERQGQLVSKQEIFDSVWAGTFVDKGVLTQNIYTLRNVLGTDQDGRQFIETVPRRGYRFAGKLTGIDNVNDVPAATGVNNGDHSRSISESTSNPTNVSKANLKRLTNLLLFGSISILILAIAGLGIYQLSLRTNTKKETAVSPIEQLRFQRLTDTGDVLFPTISPNGEMLAYVRLGGTEESVWVMQMATGRPVQTLPPTTTGYQSLAFSLDGNYLFFCEKQDDGAIYRTPVFGDTPKKVADNVWSDFSISADGRQFAFIRRDPIRNSILLILANTDGSGERELSSRETGTQGYGKVAPGWSPDGASLMVTAGSQMEARPLLYSVDVASGLETELNTPNWRGITRILWTPGGTHLIVTARASDEPTSQLWLLEVASGDVRRLTNDLESYFWTSLSADGRTLVTRQQSIVSHLWILPDGDLKKGRQITFGGRNLDGYRGLGWTVDGKIVFSAQSAKTTDLYSVNPDGTGRVQLTINAGQDNTWPAISRDGRTIAFTSHRSGARQIWRMDVDGQNQKQLTFGERPKDTSHSAAFAPEGTDVYFIKSGDGPASIWKVAADGGSAAPVSHMTDAAAEDFLSISPDGAWIAFHSVSIKPEIRSDQPMVRIGFMSTDGSANQKSFDLPVRRPLLHWGNASNFDHAAGTFNTSILMRQPLDGGEPKKLIEFPDRVFDFGWSANGKDLIVSRGKLQGDAILITNLP